MSAVVVGAILAVVVGAANVRPAEVLRTLQRISPVAAMLALLAIVTQMLFLMTRLWVFFPSARPRWVRLAYAFSVGEVVNNLMPARSGDVIKVMLLSGEPTGRSAAVTIGVLLADTAINIGALIALLLVVGPGELLGSGVWSRLAVLGLVVGMGTVIAWLVRRNARVRNVFHGMGALRSWRHVLGGLALSTGNWTAEYVALRCLSSEIGGHLGFADAIRLLFLFNVGVAFNLSVANLGTFEVPIAIGLGAAGLAFSEGLAVGAAYHVLQIVGMVLIALVMLTSKRLRPARFAPS